MHVCRGWGDVGCSHLILSLNQERVSLFPPQLGWQLASLSDTPASELSPPPSPGTQPCAAMPGLMCGCPGSEPKGSCLCGKCLAC